MMKQTPSVNVLLHFVLLPLLLILSDVAEVESYGIYNSNSVKLFVFGDSYADTGNFLNSPSYKTPYGITFPGKPGGRFSDGFVLTDYVASFLKIKTPAAYSLRNSSDLQYGINFAYGGAGVLETFVDGTPNMTVQIDCLENLIKKNVYTKADLKSSVALVSVAGNDYAAFYRQNRSITEIAPFTLSLIKQLSINLQRIHNLGINKVAIGLLQPVGCLPRATQIIHYLKCLDILNFLPVTHNELLLKTVLELNEQAGKPVYVTLDIFGAFLSVIAEMETQHFENPTLPNPLQPCCEGLGPNDHCGDVDATTGAKKYSLCEKPELSFFWDYVHPSQNGWKAISTLLQSSLGQLVEKSN